MIKYLQAFILGPELIGRGESIESLGNIEIDLPCVGLYDVPVSIVNTKVKTKRLSGLRNRWSQQSQQLHLVVRDRFELKWISRYTHKRTRSCCI